MEDKKPDTVVDDLRGWTESPSRSEIGWPGNLRPPQHRARRFRAGPGKFGEYIEAGLDAAR